MSNKPTQQAGMTLIELIVAIVIIAVGLAGVLSVFNTTVRASADPMIQKQLLAIAEGMMDEVALLPFPKNPPDDTPGKITGCTRNEADDVDDFAGYSLRKVCDLDGTPITSLDAYLVSVDVAHLSPGDPFLAVLTADKARKITVTVRRNANEEVKLIGWRTYWAEE